MNHSANLLAALAIFSGLIASGAALGATITVDCSGSGDFTTIQEAIDAASEGDTVVVAPCVYTGPLNRDLDPSEKHISLISEAGPDVTIIDCEAQGRGFYFHGGQDLSARVDGFTIRNGWHYSQGGGIMCYGSSPAISNCVIQNCSSDDGGGVLLDLNSNPRFESCIFLDNYAAFGGGFFCETSSPSLVGCDFSGNAASARGGGLFVHHESLPALDGCDFNGNHAGWDGGGMFCYESAPQLTNCSFSYNAADDGGGVHCANYATPDFSSCTFSHNAAAFGGGLFCELSSPRTEHCVFWDNHVSNRGGAIFCHQESSPLVSQCTLSGNGASEGGGVFCYESAFEMGNSIIAFSTAGPAVECEGGGSALLLCCDVYANAGGDWVGCIAGQDVVGNNLSSDPLFCGAGTGDFTLREGSPCVDGPCVLIGALGVGCPMNPVEETSWGAIKAMYR